MSNQQPVLTFKKSLLSIVIVSLVSGGLMAFEKSQKTMQMPFSQNDQQIRSQSTNIKAIRPEVALIASANRLDVQQTQGETASQSSLNEPLAAIPSEPATLVTVDKNVAVAQPIAEEHQPQPQPKQRSEAQPINDKLLFAFDSVRIQPAYYPSLTKTAQLITTTGAQQQKVWQVIGYADPSGNNIYNQKLAEKRAQMVADFLISKGVSEQQLVVVSLGSSQVDPSLSTNAIFQRRVEIHPYQAEITALAAQLKTDKEEKPSLKSNDKFAQPQNEKVTLAKPSEEQSLTSSFAQQAQSFTTAMEF